MGTTNYIHLFYTRPLSQAEIFKCDFQAERRAREELNQKKEELQEKLNQTLTELNLLKQEKMQQRHMDSYRPLPPPGMHFNISSAIPLYMFSC